MNFDGTLKSSQLRKLLIILNYSLMQSLKKIRVVEGVRFEFASFNYF
jgi:hypothetical protein